jgi:hypothetical protein
MDTQRDVTYRTFLLNDSNIRENIDPGTGIGKGITGSVIDSWDFSDVDVVQFLEKRSQQDGMDAGPPTLGGRRLRTAGTLYGKTRNLLYDGYWDLRKALSPVLALLDEPADMGYQPLYFSVPTNRQDDAVVADSGGQTAGYPSGVIDLRLLALPKASQVVWQRDQQGGPDSASLAIPWQASFLMKDPNIYAQSPQDYNLGTTTGTRTGNLVNRGTYIALLNMLMVVGSQAGTITIQLGGATNFVITVPASTGNRTIRVKGQEKVITFEENSIETLRQGSIPMNMSWPVIPSGVSAYTVTFTGVTPQTGSHLWFWETFA